MHQVYTRLVNEKRVSTYFSLTLSDIRLSRRHFKRGRKNYYCVIRKFLFKLTSYPWASTHARRRIRHYMTGLSMIQIQWNRSGLSQFLQNSMIQLVDIMYSIYMGTFSPVGLLLKFIQRVQHFRPFRPFAGDLYRPTWFTRKRHIWSDLWSSLHLIQC